MWESDEGYRVVTDSENHPVGMITDRDIAMAAYIQGVALRDARVESAMAHDVKTCDPDSSLHDVVSSWMGGLVHRIRCDPLTIG